jgi:hypothetical protein
MRQREVNNATATERSATKEKWKRELSCFFAKKNIQNSFLSMIPST